MLLRTLYRVKNAVKDFWKELLKTFNKMNFRRRKVDPCMYFNWKILGLIIWLYQIDECIWFGNIEDVEDSHNKMRQLSECDDVGNMDEYVRCKVERKEESFKLTQPVVIQSFEDEFDFLDMNPVTPG